MVMGFQIFYSLCFLQPVKSGILYNACCSIRLIDICLILFFSPFMLIAL
jgi:hypothetical protein